MDDSFDGDLVAARQRIRDLAAAACHSLDARLLNVNKHHIAAYLDVWAPEPSKRVFALRTLTDIEREKEEHARQKLSKTDGSSDANGITMNDEPRYQTQWEDLRLVVERRPEH